MNLLEFLLAFGIYGGITSALNFALAHKSQLDSWAEAHPTRAGALKLLRAVGLDPWLIHQAFSLWAKRRLPTAVRNASLAPAPIVPAPIVPTPILSSDETPLPPPGRLP